MAHWIIEFKGFGGTSYMCSNCGDSWNDIYHDVSSLSCCPSCHELIWQEENEYVEKPKTNKEEKILFPFQYMEQYFLGKLSFDTAVERTIEEVHRLIGEYVEKHS